MRRFLTMFIILVTALITLAVGQNVTEEWVVLNADADAPSWMAASDARGIDYNANSFWNGRNPSVSEVWITKATDEGAPDWIATGQARGIDLNLNSTHTGKTILFADNSGNGVHVHEAATGSYLWSLDTTGVGPVFTGHTVSPYRVAVTADGQVFVNSFDGIVVWWANDAAETLPQIVINLSGEAGNSRAVEVVGSGTDVRLFLGKGTDIRVFDMNAEGALVEMTHLKIATGWPNETETIASIDSNLVYAGNADSAPDQTINRKVYALTETGYTNDEAAVSQLPYRNYFIMQGLDVADDFYIMSESGGSYDGFAIGTIDGSNYNPIVGDTDLDNVYDGGMNCPSLATDICIDPETHLVYWTAGGADAASGYGCIRPNEFSTNSIAVADDDNNTIHIHSAVDGAYWYNLSNEGLDAGFWTASAVAPYRVAVTSDGQIFANTFSGQVVKWINDADTTRPEIVVDLSGETGNSRGLEVVGSAEAVTIMLSKGPDVRVFADDGTGTFVENVDAKITAPFVDEAEGIASIDGSTVWLANNAAGVANRAVYTWNETAYVKDETATNALPFTAFVAQGLDIDPDDNLYILGEAGGSLDGFAAGTLDGTNYPPLEGSLDNDGDGVYDGGGTINGANLAVDVAFDMVNNNLYWASAGGGGGVGMLHVILPEPVISIAEAKIDENEDFIPDRLGEDVTIQGVITSPNYGYSTQYYLQDATAGIVLFSNSVPLTLTAGDEVQITGELQQYRGITEIVPAAAEDVIVVSSGNSVTPVKISMADIGEPYEATLVMVDSVRWIDPSQWPNEGSNGSVYLTDGADTNYIFIDKETDLDGWTPPMGLMNIIAVVDQYSSSSSVYDDGYSLRGTFREQFIDLEAVVDTSITIAEAKIDENQDFIPDRLGEHVAIKGVITSPNYGYHTQYYLQDATAGIVLYSGSVDLTLNAGDEVQIVGTLTQYRGLTEIEPDSAGSVVVLSSGNSVEPVKISVADMGEPFEATVVKIDSVRWIDPSQWPNEGSNGNVYFTDGKDTNYIFIDKESDLDGWTPPMGLMNIIALVDQYSSGAAVYDDGYSLRGTFQEDFIDITPPALTLPLVEKATDGTLDLEWDFNTWAGDGGNKVYVADSTSSAWGSHVVVFEDSFDTGLAHVKDAVFTDYTIQADVYIVGEQDPDFPLYTGIGVKMAHDEGKYYRLVFRNSTSDNGQIRLQGYDGASWHISKYWNPGVDFEPLETGWHNFKVTMIGNMFWAYIDDMLLPGCPYTDSAPFMTEGQPGIYKYNAGFGNVIFDNFMVTEAVFPAPEPDKLKNLWSKSIAAGTYPGYFTPNSERGMAYGHVGDNDRLFVVAKGGGARVVVHDAWNGDSLGTLQNPEGLDTAPGYFKLNCVDVSDDGVIFACNMTLAADGTNPFTVYRWDSEAATPTSVISYNHGTGRIGDMFSVYGSASDNSLVVWAGVKDGTELIKFTTADNGMTFTPIIVSLPAGALGTAPNVAQMADGSIYVKSYGKPLIHYTAEGAVMDTVSTEVAGTSSTKIAALELGDMKLILLYYPNTSGSGNTAENLEGVNISYGDKNAFVQGYTPSIGNVANINGTGSLDFMMVGEEEVVLFILGTNNGIAAFTPSDELVLAEMDTLFYGNTPTLHANPYGWGYITGTNEYGDVGKYQRMDFNEGDELQGMMFQFATKSIIGDPDTLHMVIRSVAEDGAPSDVLMAIPVTTDMIDVSMMGNTLFLDAPMTVEGPVFIGFEMIGTWDDTLAIYADADGEGEGANRVWEQFVDGKFNDFLTVREPDYSWNVDTDLWITAYYRKNIIDRIDMTDALKVPTGFAVSQNYPNPFNPVTHFDVSLPKASDVKIIVYNALGQRVTTLVNGNLPAGVHRVSFDGSQLASGIYFYRIEAGKFASVKKMILVK